MCGLEGRGCVHPGGERRSASPQCLYLSVVFLGYQEDNRAGNEEEKKGGRWLVPAGASTFEKGDGWV